MRLFEVVQGHFQTWESKMPAFGKSVEHFKRLYNIKGLTHLANKSTVHDVYYIGKGDADLWHSEHIYAVLLSTTLDEDDEPSVSTCRYHVFIGTASGAMTSSVSHIQGYDKLYDAQYKFNEEKSRR